MKGPSVRGAHGLARGGVLEQYGEHGEQAQRSNGGRSRRGGYPGILTLGFSRVDLSTG